MALDPKWKASVDEGVTNSAWDAYDATIQTEVTAYNHKFLLAAGTTRYKIVDWRICKAIVWVESGGPASPDWKSRVMQIGNPGDPGIDVLRRGTEGSALIMSPQLASDVKAKSIDDPILNIRAGIAYLFTRMAKLANQSVMDPRDVTEYRYVVTAGDNLNKIAARVGTTLAVLLALNPDKQTMIHPKDVLKYRKASMQLVITGWLDFTTANVAARYNVGDPNYAAKLNYVLELFKRLKRTSMPSALKPVGPSDPGTTIPIAP